MCVGVRVGVCVDMCGCGWTRERSEVIMTLFSDAYKTPWAPTCVG